MTSDDPKKAAKDIADRAAGVSENVRESAASAAGKATDSVRDFAARTSEAAGDIYDKAQGHVRDASDRLPDSASEAIQAGRRAYDRGSASVGKHVAKQPIEALLLAGAIGYLLGWATNRS